MPHPRLWLVTGEILLLEFDQKLKYHSQPQYHFIIYYLSAVGKVSLPTFVYRWQQITKHYIEIKNGWKVCSKQLCSYRCCWCQVVVCVPSSTYLKRLHDFRLERARCSDYDLRVKRYFPHVKDFERAENGDIVWSSLKGPERIEVRFVRLCELDCINSPNWTPSTSPACNPLSRAG